MLVRQPGIEPTPPAVVAQIPNHWTAKEVQNHILPNLRTQKCLSSPDFLSTEVTIIRSLGLGFQTLCMIKWNQSVYCFGVCCLILQYIIAMFPCQNTAHFL